MTAAEILQLIYKTAKTLGIDPNDAYKIASIESALKTDATSPKGAMGIYQLMPGTAKEMGVDDPYDPYQNVSGGLAYFKKQLDAFKSKPLAAMAYNWGPGNVKNFLKSGRQDISKIPVETRNYVEKLYGKGALEKAIEEASIEAFKNVTAAPQDVEAEVGGIVPTGLETDAAMSFFAPAKLGLSMTKGAVSGAAALAMHPLWQQASQAISKSTGVPNEAIEPFIGMLSGMAVEPLLEKQLLKIVRAQPELIKPLMNQIGAIRLQGDEPLGFKHFPEIKAPSGDPPRLDSLRPEPPAPAPLSRGLPAQGLPAQGLPAQGPPSMEEFPGITKLFPKMLPAAEQLDPSFKIAGRPLHTILKELPSIIDPNVKANTRFPLKEFLFQALAEQVQKHGNKVGRETFEDWLNPAKIYARLLKSKIDEGVSFENARSALKPVAEAYEAAYKDILKLQPEVTDPMGYIKSMGNPKSILPTGEPVLPEVGEQKALSLPELRETLKSRLPELESMAKRNGMPLRTFLRNQGVPDSVALNISKLSESAKEFPFPDVQTTAHHAINNEQFKDWYRNSSFSDWIEGMSDREIDKLFATLAHTSRQSSPRSNFDKFLKVWKRYKASGELDKAGNLSKKELTRTLFGEGDPIVIGETPIGVKTGERKIRNFADHLIAASKNDPEAMQQLKDAVIDFRMSQYFYPTKPSTPLSELQIERAQDHLREVQKEIERITGEKWSIDQVQAALWYYIKNKRLDMGLDVEGRGSSPTTFREEMKRKAAPHWDFQGDFRELPDDLTTATVKTQWRNPTETHILDHYTDRPDIIVADPAFQGTGKPGAEIRHRMRNYGETGPARIHYYEAGAVPEREFQGDSTVRKRAVIQSGDIYNRDVDPEGFLQNPEYRQNPIELERALISKGKIGLRSGNVTVLFDKARLHDMKRYVLSLSPVSSPERVAELRQLAAKAKTPEIANELLENARSLEHINALQEAGDYEGVLKYIEDDIRKIFDSPLIDIRKISPAEGRYAGSSEASMYLDVEAGDLDVLRGRVAQFTKKYRQWAGGISRFVKPEPYAGERPEGISQHQAPSYFIKFNRELSPDEMTEMDKVLDEFGHGGSQFIPEINGYVIHHFLPDPDADYGFRNAEDFQKAVDKTYKKMLYKLRDVKAAKIDAFWFQNEMISNNWEKDINGYRYERIIKEGQKRESDLGLDYIPKVVQGGERHSGELFQKSPYIYTDRKAAAQGFGFRPPNDIEMQE